MNTTRFMSISYLRWIGVFYLLVIILAGFSQGYVRGTLLSATDASISATNIKNHLELFRLGLSTDLIAFIIDAVISIMLYQVFKPFGKSLAMIMSGFRLLAHPAIASINLINHYLAYKVLSGEAYLEVFSSEQLEALSQLFSQAHHYGYMIAGAFFGVHLLLLAVIIYRTSVLPNWLGGFLFGSAAGYLIETFGNFTFPGNEIWLAMVVGFSAAIGELGLTFYLLSKGATKKYKSKLKT